MYVSIRAAQALQKELMQRCVESGLGFRLVVEKDSAGKVCSSMKFDRRRPEDKVVQLGGVTVFSDSTSASRIKDFHLDYEGDLIGGFYLKKLPNRSLARV